MPNQHTPTFTTLDEVFSFLEQRGIKKQPLAIGIDGCTGSGKSYLGRKISKHFNIPIFDLDEEEFQVFQKELPEYRPYVDRLRIGPLRQAIEECRAKECSFVIPSVCLADVFCRLRIDSMVTIYSKVRDRGPKDWDEQDYFDPNHPRHESSVKTYFEMFPEPRLMGEIIRYHQETRPLNRADCFWLWGPR